MRYLKNLNYIELYLNELRGISGGVDYIKISDFDIANNHPSNNLYLLYLDLSGFEVRNKFKIDFSLSIDLLTNNKNDLNIESSSDLREIEKVIQKLFSCKESNLRILIDNYIELILQKQNLKIDLEEDI